MGVRAGQGYGIPKQKRMRCPECGKKGVTSGTPIPGDIVRWCMYCRASWGDAGWQRFARALPTKTTEPQP